ncbi:MAG: FecR domain-containing protein [Candidatus Thiodiazotropha lotti]
MVTRYTITTTYKRLFLFWLLSLSISTTLLADDCQPVVAHMVSLQGEAEVRRSEADVWGPVSRDSRFCPGDQLRVKGNSRVGLQLNNETFLRLSEQSSIRFAPPEDQQTSWLEIIKGIAHFISRISRPAQVNTPYVNASIEGTEFTVEVSDGSSLITVAEGRVRAHNEQGESLLTDGQAAVVAKDSAPVVRTVITPLDGVQWALYYPPIVDVKSLDGETDNSIQESYQAYRDGNPAKALARIDDSAIRDNQAALTYRASLNLMVGQIEAALADIRTLLDENPQNGDALALNSLIATIQNRSEDALAGAISAVAASPRSSAAQLALSYAKQAHFDLSQALKAAKEATRLAPESALAWSRLAQLHLMFRQMDEATAAAEKAVTIDPEIGLTQTTLGFAHLIRLDLDGAHQAFIQAMNLDQASPMPRLGLGLVTIREGDLSKGRQLIETAVHLDPGNALLRSYLGKAYYEERRIDEATKQFGLAKRRDPFDPTAWFYDAILKQSENRPVEALADIQKAIDLNDKRAVYRSRLLLDEDQASRNISQARIYTDLGVEQLARKESVVSLASDPGNASAHRFLSDAYKGVPNHESAQVSALLQSQLLHQEITVPVSPSASETKLTAFAGSGPTVAGFNEYNPMFNRQHIAILASGVTGGNNTRGSEIAIGGFTNKGMLSIGHFRESTDGFRENNNSDQTISNIFGQIRLTSDLSLQAEVKQREGESGDLVQRFNEVNNNTKQTTESDTYRLGANFTLDPSNTFLLSAIHLNLEDEDNTDNGADILKGTFEETLTEGQYIYRRHNFSLVSGVATQDSDIEINNSFLFFGNLIEIPPITKDLDANSGYMYAHIPWPNMTTVLGLEFSNVDDNDLIDKSQTNPKFGFIWDATSNTTLRLAALRTLQTSSSIQQTLKPTQVAGFNQLYDDAIGSEAWRYGIGLDSQILSNLYTGIELTRRTVTEPIERAGTLFERDYKQQYHSAYLSWPVSEQYVFGGHYTYDDFEREFTEGVANPNRPAEMKTQTLSLLAKYFHPIGFYSELEAVHVSQVIDFILEDAGTVEQEDKFWLGNFSMGLKFPKSKGIIELEVRNLFDRNFNFQSIDPGTGTAQSIQHYPERLVMLRAELWYD